MNIDKYSQYNIYSTEFGKVWLLYGDLIKFLPNLKESSKILEIWPWDWSFSFFISKYYWIDKKNFDLIDKSKSVLEKLNTNDLTMGFNNHLTEALDFLNSNEQKYDLIIMRNIIEHMDKDYISSLVNPILNSLKSWGKIFIETPNLLNFKIGIPMFYSDYSHQTWFTSKSLFDAFYWNSNSKLSIDSFNYIRKIKIDWAISTIKDAIRYSIEMLSAFSAYFNQRIYWTLSGEIKVTYTPLLICVISKVTNE
ncbi:MAG: hypothetical protein ACD_2C00189G0015 [uncultured bacterium (gcode 4)]|uniref:Methyltransferase type 12 n=1 Tax=uncultured bacterium (gcode 4) TaxID=1234023 RepID=K2FDX0_9BACT|nr:MAG: hypothetical protein ACD_2C00189G0015 [uncultured bacterium (gcode 4)]